MIDLNEDNEEIRGGTFHQKEGSEDESKSDNPDYKEDEATDTVGGDDGAEGHSEGGGHSSRVTGSNVSTSATEGETLEARRLREETEEGQRTAVESRPGAAAVETEVATSRARSSEPEDLVEEGKIDSGIEKKRDAMCEEGTIIIPTGSSGQPAAGQQDSTETEGQVNIPVSIPLNTEYMNQ